MRFLPPVVRSFFDFFFFFVVFFFYLKLKWICNERSELSVGRAARAVLHTEARHADRGVCGSVDWEELKKRSLSLLPGPACWVQIYLAMALGTRKKQKLSQAEHHEHRPLYYHKRRDCHPPALYTYKTTPIFIIYYDSLHCTATVASQN